ncbi:MAG: PilZ domain-containing protein [Elusimicrobiota bacterium]
MEGPPGGVERRKFTRYDREEVGIAIFEGDRELPEVLLRDISVHGLGLRLPERVAPGTELRFRLDLPKGPVSGEGEMIWIEPHDLGYWGGFEFRRLGWNETRKLKLCLEPGSFDWLRLFDKALAVAAAAIALLVIADLLGIVPSKSLFSLFSGH